MKRQKLSSLRGYSAQNSTVVTSLRSQQCPPAFAKHKQVFVLGQGWTVPRCLTCFDEVKCNTCAKCCTPPGKGEGWLPFPSAQLEPKWEFWVFIFSATNLNPPPACTQEKGILEGRHAGCIKPSLSLQHQGEKEQTARVRANIWNRYMGAKHRRKQQHSSSFLAG